jgi:hypothetical protein
MICIHKKIEVVIQIHFLLAIDLQTEFKAGYNSNPIDSPLAFCFLNIFSLSFKTLKSKKGYTAIGVKGSLVSDAQVGPKLNVSFELIIVMII